jgi:hypothetical protein
VPDAAEAAVAAVVTLPPWLVGLCLVYVIAITFLFVLFGVEQLQQRRKPAADHDAEILAVAEQGLTEALELADDAEAAARTVLALEEVAALRRLARADGEEASFRTPERLEADIFLMRLFRTRPQGPS